MLSGFRKTPILGDLPRYFPGIGQPREMSPIHNMTNVLENETPPVMEVTPGSDDYDSVQIQNPLANRFL